MAKLSETDKNKTDDAKDLEKVLAVVIKRRKTIPAKCIAFHRRIAAVELLRLQNSVIVPENNIKKDNIQKSTQGLKKSNELEFSFDDLKSAENELKKYFTKVNEINLYLKSTRGKENCVPEIS